MGEIKATVLNAKQGIITEERFQKMTHVQWYFHYLEVLKFKDEKDEAIYNLFKRLMGQLELVGTMANPEAGKALDEAKKLDAQREEIDADAFSEDFKKLKEFIPATLKIKVKENDNKMILPAYTRENKKKKLGIFMEESGEK